MTATVKAAKGKTVPTGSVEFFVNGQDFKESAVLDKKGHAAILTPSTAASFPGSFTLSFRYNGSSKFAKSTSKTISASIKLPKLTTQSDGLKVATVVAGKGTATVKTGNRCEFEDIGYVSTGGSPAFESAVHTPTFFTVTVGATPTQSILAFDEGAVGMKVGEVRVIIAPPSLALNDGKTYYLVLILKKIVS